MANLKFVKDSVVTRVAVAMVSSAGLLGLGVLPTTVGASESHMPKEYTVTLQPLNNSGVTGTAKVLLSGTTLRVRFDAKGLQPNMSHDAHIHGMLNGADANCPTVAQDTNGDGYISVFEGAPAYGVIKVSLSKPITAAGPNTVAALFAPYAGMDSNSFQSSDSQGMDHYDQSITYNLSDKEAAAAYNGIMPLQAQEIVIHGAMAPESVDTVGGSTSKIVYDELLPVACGDLKSVLKGESVPMPSTVMNNNQQAGNQMSDMSNMNMYQMDMPNMQKAETSVSSSSSNIDQQISDMYSARNLKIDLLNQAGNVGARDSFLAMADTMIQKFVDAVRMR